MTLRASSTKKTVFNLFSLTFRKNFGITALVSAFMLLICPGYILVEVERYLEYREVFNFNDTLPSLTGVISVLTCAIAVIYCFLNFAFMYSKKSGDMYYALPLTRNGLLLSRLFASVIPVMIPIILCYGSMGLILLSDAVTGDFLPVVLSMICNILLVVMSCCITMIFIVCAGSITDLLISYFGLNIGIIVTAFIIYWLCDDRLFGFYSYNSEDFIISSSPFLFGFVHLVRISEAGFVFDIGLLTYLLKIIVISLVCFVGAVLLFRKRKSEKCTSAYAYKGMYRICGITVGFICTFLIGMIFGGGESGILFWIFGILGALLGAVTFGLITDRGFKTIKHSLILGACSFGIMAVLAVILETGGLGYTERVPKAEDVKSVCVVSENFEVEFKNPQLVINLHKKALESGDIKEVELAETAEYSPDTEEMQIIYGEYSTSYIRLEYRLKNGLKLNREFRVMTKDCDNELFEILKSQENIKHITDKVDSYVDSVEVYGYNGINEDEYLNTDITTDEAKMITKAYIADLLESDKRIVYGNYYSRSLYLDGVNKEDKYENTELYVGDDFHRTIKVLQDLKLMERTKAENK